VTLALARVDDRLIHGQVVLGWGRPLGASFIVLVDDAVRASEWEQELYRLAAPPEMEVVFASVEEAVAALPGWLERPERGILLTADVATMAALQGRSGGRLEAVNLGGIHHRPGRTQRLPWVYLSEEEYGRLADLVAAGVRVTAQDVPATSAVPLESLR
jgi:PTS system mannose-specific IIB component/fructoselysine and glucoselysine-specific PTS system IIB component